MGILGFFGFGSDNQQAEEARHAAIKASQSLNIDVENLIRNLTKRFHIFSIEYIPAFRGHNNFYVVQTAT